MRRVASVIVWTISILCLVVGALLATEFGFMATSVDPGDLISSGIDAFVGPWTEAAIAVALFLTLAASVALSLRLWHTQRFKPVSIALTCGEVGAVAWACVRVYHDYF